MTALPDFGAALRAARLDAGLSQRQLAEASGRAQQNISGYENGFKAPNLATLLSLTDALGYDVVLRRRDRPDHLPPRPGAHVH